MTATTPSPAEQIEFLGNVERLLAEGQFSATYKYALLVALADLAVEHGRDDRSQLQLPVRLIGERFVRKYRPQVLPFSPSVRLQDALYTGNRVVRFTPNLSNCRRICCLRSAGTLSVPPPVHTH